MDSKTAQTELSASLEDRIADGIARGLASVSPKKVTFGRYDPKTPFHPVRIQTPKLLRPSFQNGRMMNAEMLHDAEIKLLNQIHRPGRYLDRNIEVVISEDGSESVLDLRYRDKSVDDRFFMKGLFRNLQDLLEQIVKEQAVLDEEELTTPAKRRA